MAETAGTTVRMEEVGDQFFLKFLGERQVGVVGKVSIVAHHVKPNPGSPGGIGLAKNDGSGDAYRPWAQVPAHLKLKLDGQEYIDFQGGSPE